MTKDAKQFAMDANLNRPENIEMWRQKAIKVRPFIVGHKDIRTYLYAYSRRVLYMDNRTHSLTQTRS